MKKPATKAVTMEAPVREAGEGVAAVERALSIVAALETADQPMTLAELAVRTGFYKSTILRLLGSLIPTGYVTRLPDGSYDLGPTAFRLGVAFTRKNALGHHVVPALQELVDRGTESASFHVRQDADNRVCLFRVNSRHATLDRVEAGHSYALLRGAAGHIILAYAGSTGPRYDTIRTDGFNVSLGERDPSCAAVAAPVFGPRGMLVGVISLSGPRERFGEAEIAEMKRVLGPVAEKLTINLGGEWPVYRR
ncbi:DNA-binding IclR family transcriptional regulator [Tardiphaga robiniae]|uniref:IclR family transcriptional regulator n=1 Tax=Tardiphaga robiniae TaxID=943830 RepID=UPI00285F54F4|nr:helix-turn-helix domain-containing protein [Tardiphaga robiniae]MDR6659338.1 DNA-binding IclR family transcriptional regulator [Tardiphaga robiniae]